jgi:hypothetical protein
MGRPHFLAFALFLAACHPSPKSPPVAAAPFSLTVETGGGFTGTVTGCTLASDGSATAWRRLPAPGDTVLAHSVAATEKVAALRKRIEDAGLPGLRQAESGNMTTALELRLPDTVYTWSWPGNGVTEKLPESLRRAYAEVRAYCDEVLGRAP